MTLPRFIGLQSLFNQSYLVYVDSDSDTAPSLISLTGEEITSPTAKFAIEPAKNSTTLVNIRCFYNNKYLAKQSQADGSWIVAGADEPDEDQSTWSCTLFEPIYSSSADSTQIQYFQHAQQSKTEYVASWTTKDSNYGCLYTTTTQPDSNSACSIIDLESMVVLPKQIVLSQGDNTFITVVDCVNVSQPGVGTPRSYHYQRLMFAYNRVGDLTVGNEVVTNKDGSISIKSNYAGRFWESNADCNEIRPDYDSAESLNSRFWPVKIDSNVIALRVMSSNNFCVKNDDNVLVPTSSTIIKEARLVVSEPVLSRMIYNIDYHLSDTRIYNETVDVLATGVANNGTEQDLIVYLILKYKVTTITTWNNSIMGTLGLGLSFEGGLPVIVKGKVEVSEEISGGYEWGGSYENTTDFETGYHVVVPPKSKVNISMLATKGSYDVPFSYVQRDTLWNGNHIITEGSDGIYTGYGCYNFRYLSEEA